MIAFGKVILALALLIAGDVSMWLTLTFPVWVLVVNALILLRKGSSRTSELALVSGLPDTR